MIEIATATPADAGTIADLQIAMALETESLQLDRPTVLKGVGAVFDDPAKGTYYVAKQHGNILAVMLVIPEWSDWRNAAVLWIHSLYVIPAHRNKRLFTRMFSELKDRVSRSENLAGLRLFVDKNNTRARRIYKKLGMTEDHYQLYEWLK